MTLLLAWADATTAAGEDRPSYFRMGPPSTRGRFAVSSSAISILKRAASWNSRSPGAVVRAVDTAECADAPSGVQAEAVRTFSPSTAAQQVSSLIPQ